MTSTTRILVAARGERAPVIAACLRTFLPTAEVEIIEASALTRRKLPNVNCAVVASGFGDWGGPVLGAARALRAAGFEGAMVAITDADPADEERHALRAIGVEQVVPSRMMASALAPAVTAALALDEDAPAVRELRHAQRMIAAGEIARSIQHAANNPLTALLAELQLLEMEPLTIEQLDAVRRVVELCRRVASTVRQLDVVALPGIGVVPDARPGASRVQER